MKACKIPEMISSGNVNLNGAVGKSEEGLRMMKLILEYNHMKWGVIKATDAEKDAHLGRKIQNFINHSAYVIRGFFNVDPSPLESYERDAKFLIFKARMLEKGRLAACTDPDPKISSLTHMLPRLTGITLTFVLEMRENGIPVSIQQILGSEWCYFFRLNYMKYSDKADHYEILTDKLPTYCPLPINQGRTIFKVPVVHRDVILKKKASYEIKPYRG